MKTLIQLLTLLSLCCAQQQQQQPTLRVCADPNNLPYSNANGEGFENKIANVIAGDLHANVHYTWLPQRLGFVRNTLKRGDCDVIIGVPANFEQAAATAPYYRSSYVFVTRKGKRIESLDDAALKSMRIGVQVGSPAAIALASRHLQNNIRGFPVLDAGTRTLIDAVVRGDVGVAIVWGPQAGWFTREHRAALDLVPLSPQIDPPFLPFVFDISMGVRRGDTKLRERLDAAIDRRRGDIEKILDDYGVPRV
jgi:mxaJ protein